MNWNISFRHLIFLIWIFGIGAKHVNVVDDGGFVPVTQQPLTYFPQSRIVGGQDAKDNQFPHQISLQMYNQHICGGSIVSEKYIVTAAHCVCTSSENSLKMFPISQMKIRAGSRLASSGGVEVELAQAFVHPNYGNFENDIAIVELKKPLQFNDSIRPIALATQKPKPGTKIVTSGWGLLSTNGDMPQILQYNTLVSMSNSECRRRIGNVPKSLLCLGHTDGNGVCNGDSGGPAVYKNQLVGVTNFVINGCGSNAPDGYASVPSFVDWIRKVAKLQ